MRSARLVSSAVLVGLALSLLANAAFLLPTIREGRTDLHFISSLVDDDSSRYLSRIREFTEGKFLMGNPVIYEHRYDVPPGGLTEVVTGFIGQVLHSPLEKVVFFTSIAFPALIFALWFLWLSRLFRSSFTASVAALLIAVDATGITNGVLRETHPKVTMVLFSIYLCLVFMPEKPTILLRILRGVCIGAMTYTYPYHWTLAFVFEGILIVREFLSRTLSTTQILKHAASIVFPILLLSVPYALFIRLSTDPAVLAATQRHLALIHHRTLVAPTLQFELLLLLAFTLGIQIIRRDQSERRMTFAFVFLAGLCAVNSNLMTGVEAEFLGHYGRVLGYFYYPALILGVQSVIPSVWQRRTLIGIGLFAIFTFLTLLPRKSAQIDALTKAIDPDTQHVLSWAQALSDDQVILAPHNLARMIPAATKHYAFMNVAAKFFLVPEEELLARYAVWTAHVPTAREDTSLGVGPVFGNYPGQVWSRTRRLHQLRTLLSEPFSLSIADFIPDQRMRRFLDRVNATADIPLVRRLLQSCRLDIAVLDVPLPRGLSDVYRKTKTFGRFSVYQYIGPRGASAPCAVDLTDE